MTPKSMVFAFYHGEYCSSLFLFSLSLGIDGGDEQELGKRRWCQKERDRAINTERDFPDHAV